MDNEKGGANLSAMAWLGNIILLTYTIIRYGQSYRTFLIPWGLYCLLYLAYVLFYFFFMKIMTNYTLMSIAVENQKVELNSLRISILAILRPCMMIYGGSGTIIRTFCTV